MPFSRYNCYNRYSRYSSSASTLLKMTSACSTPSGSPGFNRFGLGGSPDCKPAAEHTTLSCSEWRQLSDISRLSGGASGAIRSDLTAISTRFKSRRNIGVGSNLAAISGWDRVSLQSHSERYRIHPIADRRGIRNPACAGSLMPHSRPACQFRNPMTLSSLPIVKAEMTEPTK